MPSLARHRWRSLSFLAPIAVLWLAFGLRMLDVTVRSLWYDEAVEYLTASVPLGSLAEAVVTANYQPPLYSYLLHLWLGVSIASYPSGYAFYRRALACVMV
jgi:hypothetical protein